MDLERWRAEAEGLLTEAPVEPSRLRFRPEHLIIARGALDTPPRRAFVEKVRAAFPEASVARQLDRPPARTAVPADDDAARRRRGKRTLVIGALRKLTSRNDDAEMRGGVVCRPYPEFSAGVGYCPFDCRFCYVAGNRGVLASPTVKVYVNVEEILEAVARRLAARGSQRVTCRAWRSETPSTAAACGEGAELWVASKLGDPLALEPLTHYAQLFVPFFAEQEHGRLLYLTKSAGTDDLLGLRHNGRTVLSWSLNADTVSRTMEEGAPSLDERLAAAARAAAAGYEVRFVLMPIIPVESWEEHYEDLVARALGAVRPSRLTLGSICIYPTALRVMERRFGRGDPVSRLVQRGAKGRLRFAPEVREAAYRQIIAAVRRREPELPVALCLETQGMWERLGLDPEACLCNCG